MTNLSQSQDHLFLQMLANKQKFKVEKTKQNSTTSGYGADVRTVLKQIEREILSHDACKSNEQVQLAVLDLLKNVKKDIQCILNN